VRTEHKPALGAELVIPLIAAGLTAYFLYSVSGVEWEAKANGVIIGSMLLVLIAVQVVRLGVAFAQGRASGGSGALFTPREALPKRIGMLIVTIVFVATVPWLGLALGLFGALVAALLVMGERRWKRIFAVAFSIALVASLLFTVALDSGLPKGPVENLVIRLVR
jgi:hypothetical protein